LGKKVESEGGWFRLREQTNSRHQEQCLFMMKYVPMGGLHD
jgi:hypothetical protein